MYFAHLHWCSSLCPVTHCCSVKLSIDSIIIFFRLRCSKTIYFDDVHKLFWIKRLEALSPDKCTRKYRCCCQEDNLLLGILQSTLWHVLKSRRQCSYCLIWHRLTLFHEKVLEDRWEAGAIKALRFTQHVGAEGVLQHVQSWLVVHQNVPDDVRHASALSRPAVI